MTSASLTAQRDIAMRDPAPDPIPDIVTAMRGWSLEATLPNEKEIAALATIVAPKTPVYLSAVATRDPMGPVDAALRLAAAGLEPVPHLAVRNFASTALLERFLARMREAGVRRVLVIAGDRDRPAGSLGDAMEAIDSGVLQRHGIDEIGIAGYPEGHPGISEQQLDRALREKIDIAAEIGLRVHIVTQFCFEADPIIRWTGRLRDFGVETPVRIGLAGPTNITTLLRYARRCGVLSSAQGLARQSGLARQMFGMSAPDGLVRAIAEARTGRQLGDIALHFFSFGGIAATARWAAAVAAGRIIPDATGSFQVAPP
jgi:methylenetetrahydrofolate reductase (NADPH)